MHLGRPIYKGRTVLEVMVRIHSLMFYYFDIKMSNVKLLDIWSDIPQNF